MHRMEILSIYLSTYLMDSSNRSFFFLKKKNKNRRDRERVCMIDWIGLIDS
jgi:hypothetical protein